jgi:hypothetical protein
MKIEENFVKEMTIEEFAELHDLTMEINERPNSVPTMRFYASFKHTEVMLGRCLGSVSGDGETIEEAIQAYAQNISLQKIAVDAFKSNRREIDVPRLIGVDPVPLLFKKDIL